MRTDLTAPGAAVLRRRRSTAENRQELLRLLGRIAVLAALAVVLFSQVFLITQAPDNGMFPAVKDGDLLIGFRLQRRFVKNQLVLYRQGGQMRLGRVLGVAGDVIVLDDSGVPLVNGTAQSGEILYPTYPREGGTLRYPYTVPDGCVFLLGDCRTQCQDSRDFGGIPLQDVQGKLISLLRRRSL